jgi:hypothetical protein
MSNPDIPDLYFFPFTDSDQMEQLHPHFWFHTGDWLTHHFLITHCQAMSCSIPKPDPDLKTYNKYQSEQKQIEMNEADQDLKKCHIEMPN